MSVDPSQLNVSVGGVTAGTVKATGTGFQGNGNGIDVFEGTEAAQALPDFIKAKVEQEVARHIPAITPILTGPSVGGPTADLLSSGRNVCAYFTNAEVLKYDTANKAQRNTVVSTQGPDRFAARPEWDYNLVLNGGQSEGYGQQSLPIRSTSQPYDNLMIGKSTRPNHPDTATSWTALGSTAFTPLVADAWDINAKAPLARNTALTNYVYVPTLTIDGSRTVLTDSTNAIDFTKSFQAGDYIQFNGFTGGLAPANLQGSEAGNNPATFVTTHIPWTFGGTGYTQIKALTAHTLTLWVALLGTETTQYGVEVALYQPLMQYLGEDNLVSQLNHERAMDTAKVSRGKLVGMSTNVGGQPIAALSKGASANYYNRVPTAVSTFKNVAAPLGTFGVSRINWLQGGSDGGTPQATYLAAMLQWFKDARADAKALTGQTKDPIAYWFVLSGGNQYNGGTPDVSAAQVQAARDNLISNGYCVGPGYAGADYYAHWSPNAEVWFGAMMAKIVHRTQYLGQGWKPLHVINSVFRGNEILLNCHVPVGALQIKKAWAGQVYDIQKDLGFKIIDPKYGNPEIESISIVADTVICIRLASIPNYVPKWMYASWQPQGPGNGNICDSDPAVSFQNYIWQAGMPFTERRAELINKPMTLENWLCPDWGTPASV